MRQLKQVKHYGYYAIGLLALMGSLSLLAGCGQKGDLYRTATLPAGFYGVL